MKLLTLLLPHFSYPIARDSHLLHTRPHRAVLETMPLVIYRDPHLIVHHDVCPHQGAALSGGKIITTPSSRRLLCPYHGFSFDRGRFCGVGTAGVTHRPGRLVLALHACESDGTLIYCSMDGTSAPIYRAPESTNPDFTVIHGSREIPAPHMVVTENVLDMLHISEVHAFGVPGEIARHIRYEATGAISGRTTFDYTPRPGSLATILGGIGAGVVVENEFHLPTTTVTRVSVRGWIKTVVTRAQPIDDSRCRLYWSVYRNFVTSPLFDGVMRFMMERTLDEDVRVLSTVTYVPRPQVRMPHDVTIFKYRAAVAAALTNGSCGGGVPPSGGQNTEKNHIDTTWFVD
jgi:phenylpropionate dioxygenase-like ring-hydroxylating dioxygenase large terminal subunit